MHVLLLVDSSVPPQQVRGQRYLLFRAGSAVKGCLHDCWDTSSLSRHALHTCGSAPSQVDIDCAQWLAECEVPFAIIFTKV